jgi:hypothetical protein
MTEMLDLKPQEFILLEHEDLNEIVWKYFNITYVTLYGIDNFYNDVLLGYTVKDDYDILLEDLVNWQEDIQKWKETSLKVMSMNLPAIDWDIYTRAHVHTLDWKVMITLLIVEGRIPKANYLLSTAC